MTHSTLTTDAGTFEGPVELAVLWKALADFDADLYEDNFIVLEAEPPINGSLYLQSALMSDPGEAKRYVVETRIADEDGGFCHYQWESDSLSQVQAIFADYYLRQQLPDLTDWKDITDIFK